MLRRTMVAVLGIAALTAGCTRATEGGTGPDGPRRDGGIELVANLRSFEACDDLLGYFRTEGAKSVGPYGFEGGYGVMADRNFSALATTGADTRAAAGAAESAVAAPPATSAPAAGGGLDEKFSGTNVQEAGVDEPDLVKTDGERLVTHTRGTLRVVDVAADAPRLLGSVAVGSPYSQGQLFLAGDRVLVLGAEEAHGDPRAYTEDVAPGVITPPDPGQLRKARTTVTVVDIADAGKPRVLSVLTVDGSLVSARSVDGIVRLVLRSGPPPLAFTTPDLRVHAERQSDLDAVTAANRKVVEQSKLDDWMAGYVYDEPGNPAARAEGLLTDCEDVRHPQRFSGLDTVSVVAVDPNDPRPGPAATVVGAGETVYASAKGLYVTSMTRPDPRPIPAPQVDPSGASLQRPESVMPPSPTETDIHKFDISDKVATRYVGSGRVKGHVLNQFSLSEHDEHLRVATTVDSNAESLVSVLREQEDALAVVGEVGGLGKDERIYSVRFLGDRGYVVTFRETDPLYVIDLSDPTKPSVRGELKIPGYSAYLHPLGEHRLLGIGQDANDRGRTLGTQISLFDVSDPGDPKRLANATLPGAHSEAEYDHHAFLYWAKTGLAMLPMQSYGDVSPEPARGASSTMGHPAPFVGAVGFRIGQAEVVETGRVNQRDGQAVRRSLVVGERLLTLSDGGLLTSDLTSLAERSWLGL